MRTLRSLFAAAALLSAGPLAAAPAPSASVKSESPAAAARRALDDVGDYHYQARSLNDVLAEVKDRSRVNVTLDPNVMNYGLDPNLPSVNVDLKRAKLRDALKAILAPHNLRVGIIRDGLYISHDDGVTAYQLRQSVSVDCDGTLFEKAVAALIADTGANVVVDPRLKEKAAVPIVLKLDEVPLETAIRLLSEMADLRAVRMSNVIFITSKDRAESLRKDADGPIPPAHPTPGVQQINLNGVGFGGFGGIAVPALPAIAPVPAPPAPEPAPAVPEPK